LFYDDYTIYLNDKSYDNVCELSPWFLRLGAPVFAAHLLNYSTSQLLKVSLRVNGRLPLYLQYPTFQSQRNPAITDPYRLRQFSPVVLRNTSFEPTYTQHFICHTQDWVSTTSLPSGHPARQLPPSLLCCTLCACCCHPISLSASSRSTSLKRLTQYDTRQ